MRTGLVSRNGCGSASRDISVWRGKCLRVSLHNGEPHAHSDVTCLLTAERAAVSNLQKHPQCHRKYTRMASMNF
ncbi:hypothetical protein DMI62_22000 [Escherichia coli]|nr:hypothetical protein [Escherichia coli]